MQALDLGRVVGMSAYELAVSKGYEGTLEAWLESLRYDHSDEYKQFTATIEEAQKEILSGKEEIKSDKEEIKSSMAKIRDLVETSLTDIKKSQKDGVDAVDTASTSAISSIASREGTALANISSTESAALTSLADALTSAVASLNTAGSRWEQQLKDSGEKAQFDYNQNATKKTEAFDTHVSEKQDAFDTHAEEKQNSFDENATQKTQEFDTHTEQIQNDIGQLKEDISTKITKFYASNQGETHLADSDNGKIMDMMLYGKSEQFTTTGKNLFNPFVGGFISNTDGSISLSDISRAGATDFIKINGKDITVIARNFSLSMADAYAYRIGFYNSEKAWIKNIALTNGNEYSISKAKVTDAEYIRVSVPSAVYNTIQVEYGSEATTYEPYTGGQPSPSPDYPQEIKSVVNPTVKVSNEDGTESQTVTLPYTLNAIPVTSGGNVTIDGQQYIADYVDVERGKLVRMCKKKAVPNNVDWILQAQSANYKIGYSSKVFDDMASTKESTKKAISNLGSSSSLWSNKFCFGKSNVFWINPYANNGELTSNDINNFLTEHPMEVVYPLITPIEEELTPEEIAAFKALATHYPVTNISANSEQLDGYTMFNYPISLANGWNYVKQQLNDNRDYIYDMDLQSAEAYVNSEYAVALTELEV